MCQGREAQVTKRETESQVFGMKPLYSGALVLERGVGQGDTKERKIKTPRSSRENEPEEVKRIKEMI